jgi:hypothetical protein
VEKDCGFGDTRVRVDVDGADRSRKDIRCKVVIVEKPELTHTAQLPKWELCRSQNGAMERRPLDFRSGR